ncbi:unnamed protein product [Thlaspi arvense]|uniref:RmlD-like substrate binding domain-containing protein n=1 Tax=Thlaspi arvense TaxID=13288 RepID=A0AAU9SRD4_THLAR|nr:unnamed protein product [Thlaspi arvense]
MQKYLELREEEMRVRKRDKEQWMAHRMLTEDQRRRIKILVFKSNAYLRILTWLPNSVYQGAKSFYKEEDETVAVNVYGKSKVAAELLIKDKYQNFTILSSTIIGPQTWMDSVLQKGDTVEFFHDEYRCPIYVKDLVSIAFKLIHRWVVSDDKQMRLVLNAGGPDRLSRVQMAEVVAQVRGYDLSLIKHVSATSVCVEVDRGVVSPADISMDITKLIQILDIDMPRRVYVSRKKKIKEAEGINPNAEPV